MALSALITWEVRFTGADTNGGGFKTGATGTDRSQQDAAQATLTVAATVHTTTTQLNVPGGEHTVSASDVGNVFQLAGGTATAGFYEITSVDVPNNRWVVDRSLGTAAQTAPGKMGGGLGTPGRAGGAKVAGNDVFIKYSASTYDLSSASANVAGGTVSDTTGGVDQGQSFWTGYDTTRTHLNTDTNRPTMKIPAAGVATVTVFNVAGLSVTVRNLIVDGNAKTAIRGFDIAESFGGARAINCKGLNCTNGAFFLGDSSVALCCEATGCSTIAAYSSSVRGATLYACTAHDNTVTGFSMAGFAACYYCVSESNSGASSSGFLDSSTADGIFVHCIAYNNGSHGFSFSSGFGRNQTCVNCVADSNTGNGFHSTTASLGTMLIGCAYRNNTAGNVNANITIEQGSVLLTAAPFIDAAGGDFRPNKVPGGGMLLRDAAYPTTLPGTTTTHRLDIGGAQHDDFSPRARFQLGV